MKKLATAAVLALAAYTFAVWPPLRAGVSCSVPFNLTNGTTADASQVMANYNAILACLLNNTAESGANSSITSLSGLTTPLSVAQGGTARYWGGTSGGTNTVTVTTVSPAAGFSLAAGVEVCFNPGGANTGATTLNVNSTGAINFRRFIQGSTGITGGTFVGGELVAAVPVCALYNGSVYVLRDRIDIVGEIKDFGGVAGAGGCPTGWQEVTGGNVVAATFPDINTAYGTLWGSSAGNVVMPDLRGSATYSRDQGGSGRLTTGANNAGLDGTTVGSTVYRQNQTLTQAQLPSFTMTGTFTATNSIANHLATSNGAFTGTLITTSGGTSVPNCNGVCSDTNGYTPTGTVTAISSGGGGTAHPIVPNAGIVTKCVKL